MNTAFDTLKRQPAFARTRNPATLRVITGCATLANLAIDGIWPKTADSISDGVFDGAVRRARKGQRRQKADLSEAKVRGIPKGWLTVLDDFRNWLIHTAA